MAPITGDASRSQYIIEWLGSKTQQYSRNNTLFHANSVNFDFPK